MGYFASLAARKEPIGNTEEQPPAQPQHSHVRYPSGDVEQTMFGKCYLAAILYMRGVALLWVYHGLSNTPAFLLCTRQMQGIVAASLITWSHANGMYACMQAYTYVDTMQ